MDSYLLPQKWAAVGEWEERASLQFHMMRDRPFHITTILAGLWGANKYLNFRKAANVRSSLPTFTPGTTNSVIFWINSVIF